MPRLLAKMIDWWNSLHVCDDEIIDHDAGGCVYQCRTCKRIWLYRP